MNVRRLLFCAGAAATLGAGGWWADHEQAHAHAAQREWQRQQPELQDCRRRLTELHRAWRAYRLKHGGAEPPSVAALVPADLSDPRRLCCPTAERARLRGLALESGTFRLGRRQYQQTYGLVWLGANYAARLASQGERAPLVVCTAHREVMHHAACAKRLPPEGFAGDGRGRLPAAVARAPVLTMRRDGTIDE